MTSVLLNSNPLMNGFNLQNLKSGDKIISSKTYFFYYNFRKKTFNNNNNVIKKKKKLLFFILKKIKTQANLSMKGFFFFLSLPLKMHLVIFYMIYIEDLM